MIGEALDTGTGYTRKAPAYNAGLTEVGRGKPMGELLRRYWHPIALVADAGATPKPVRVLGEDLILFRDGAGRAGLVEARCCHRGTTLYYGRVEERGIRCCYHGWLFDVEGHCLEQPCEPEGGPARERVRQPWYPVQERYGLIFAYMGPPEKQAGAAALRLPRDARRRASSIEADDSSVGSAAARDRALQLASALRERDRIRSTSRFCMASFSGPQFIAQMGMMPEVTWDVDRPGREDDLRRALLDDGASCYRISEAVLPTLRVVPNPRVGAVCARGDRSAGCCRSTTRQFPHLRGGQRAGARASSTSKRSRMNGKLWEELTAAEHQRLPGRLRGAGRARARSPCTPRRISRSSDRGVVMVRRRLQGPARRGRDRVATRSA